MNLKETLRRFWRRTKSFVTRHKKIVSNVSTVAAIMLFMCLMPQPVTGVRSALAAITIILIVQLYRSWRSSDLSIGQWLSHILKSPLRAKDAYMEWWIDLEPIYFNDVTWNVFRWTAGPIFAILLLLLFQLLLIVVSVILSHNIPLLPVKFLLPAALGITAWFGYQQGDANLTVPPTKAIAQVLWRGIAIPFYLRTSTYSWTGENLGFSISQREVREFTRPGTGFINAGEIQFEVYNHADAAAGTDARKFITAPAKNQAETKIELTLIVEVVKPRKLLDSDRPDIDLGNRARQEVRELATKFVDTDMPRLHSVIGNVLRGQALVTCFTGKALPGFKQGAMVRNYGDESMFKLVKPLEREHGESDEDFKIRMKAEIEATKVAFRDDLERHANKALLKGAVNRNDKKYVLTVVQVENPITEVLTALGLRLVRVTIGDIDFTPEVKQAAANNSAEEDDARAQLASADSIKRARDKLMPTDAQARRPGFETAQVLAASKDDKTGNIRVVHVTGTGNELGKTLVAAATQNNQSDKGGKK